MYVKALPVIATAFAFAAPLYAQNTQTVPVETAPAIGTQTTSATDLVTAEMIEDARIVSLQGQYREDIWNSGEPLNTMVADLTEIGEVEDIVMSPDGQVQGLTTDVGGFLGLGQKQVLIPLDDIRLTRGPDSDNLTIITRMSDEALQSAPEFELDD